MLLLIRFDNGDKIWYDKIGTVSREGEVLMVSNGGGEVLTYTMNRIASFNVYSDEGRKVT